jgi:hypothetical protein
MRRAIQHELARATSELERVAGRWSISLPNGVDGLRLVPCAAPAPPEYGTRIGTWLEAESFLLDWAMAGKSWVNIGLRVDSAGDPFLCYEVPDRGSSSEPTSETWPSVNINGPLLDSRSDR